MLIKESQSFFGTLFLHFFDLHFLDHKGVRNEGKNIKKLIKDECDLATRIALLASDTVYVPASSFFESDICYEIISKYQELYHAGRILLVGGGSNLTEFVEEKLSQYRTSAMHFEKYKSFKSRLPNHPPFYSRKQSATKDISFFWKNTLSDGSAIQLLKPTMAKLPKDFEKRWGSVGDKLSGRAFIVDNVSPMLFKTGSTTFSRNRLHSIINEPYFGSFTKELAAGVVSNMAYLESPHRVPSYGRNLPYKQILQELQRTGILDDVRSATASDLLRIKESGEWKSALAAGLEKASLHHRIENMTMSVEFMKTVDQITIGVITALPKEFAAVCYIFSANETINFAGSGGGRSYAWAKVNALGGGSHNVAVSLLSDMGNNSASIRASQMFNFFPNMQHIIMTGIAGAVPHPSDVSNHVRLGDLVVSNQNGVVQYDFEKVTPTEVENRSRPRPPAAGLIDAVNLLVAGELMNKRPWEEYIFKAIDGLGSTWDRPADSFDILDDGSGVVTHPIDRLRTHGVPRLFLGTIASANKLLKDPKLRDALRDKFSVRAVEMEGAGIADSTWGYGSGYLVIRGTCDYCNLNKNDDWQKYASIIAAAFTRCTLENTPLLTP